MPKGPSGQQFEPGPPKWVPMVPAVVGMALGTTVLLRYHVLRPTILIIAAGLFFLFGCAAALWSRHAKRS